MCRGPWPSSPRLTAASDCLLSRRRHFDRCWPPLQACLLAWNSVGCAAACGAKIAGGTAALGLLQPHPRAKRTLCTLCALVVHHQSVGGPVGPRLAQVGPLQSLYTAVHACSSKKETSCLCRGSRGDTQTKTLLQLSPHRPCAKRKTLT